MKWRNRQTGEAEIKEKRERRGGNEKGERGRQGKVLGYIDEVNEYS